MKITAIFVLFTLSAIAQGQWVAAARNFYQPVILSVGAAFSFMASDRFETDSSSRWSEWITNNISKEETKETKETQPKDPLISNEDMKTLKDEEVTPDYTRDKVELTKEEIDEKVAKAWAAGK